VADESQSRLVPTWKPGGPNAALAAAAAYARDAAAGSCAVVLVEGMSDQFAVEALAARRGRDLNAQGVFTVPMGGATNIGRFLRMFGPRGLVSGWRACATRLRSAISGAVLTGLVWAPP
jgi:hypothetical protein